MADFKQHEVNNYFKGQRASIAELVEKGSNRVLDVGCGVGNFGGYLKQHRRADAVIGIEIDQLAAAEARKNLDGVYCVDLNRVEIAEIFSNEKKQTFDYIVCNDVLEHLVDPWKVLKDLTSYLAEGGKIIASIPNARHWSVWAPLVLHGAWKYQDAGIMDRTHLRFFTKKTMKELFNSANLSTAQMRPLIGGKWRYLNQATFNLIEDFVTVQWVLVGKARSEKI